MTMMNPRVHAHKLVAETAEGLASAAYGVFMVQTPLYDAWKKRHPKLSGEALERAFVKAFAPSYILPARDTLAGMLGNPAYSHLHEEISEALILDNQFRRTAVSQAAGMKLFQEAQEARSKS